MADLSREQMIEALQAKREVAAGPRPVSTRAAAVFSVCGLAMFVALALIIVHVGRPAPPSAPAAEVEHLKTVADRLKVQGLPAQALRYYERYLAAADIPPGERANVSFLAAELAVTIGRYEEALAWLASAEAWGPAESVKGDVARLQRLCFERLGRSADADYQLAASASLDADANPRGAVVAKIGSERITMGDVDDALQALPKRVQDVYSKPGKKAEFIQHYVNNRILLRKAKNLGYDKDPEVRKQVETAQTELVVGAFLKKEIQDKVQVTDSELELFYKVNQDRYREPGRARIAHILVPDEKTAAGLVEKALAGADFADLAKEHSKDGDTRGSGGEAPGWLVQGGALAPLPKAEGLSEAMFALEPGALCPKPIKSARGWHAVKLLQKSPARVKPLSEVKEQVQAAYRSQKQQEALVRLLGEAQEQLKVQIFPAALAADAPAAQAPRKVKLNP